LRLSHMGSWSWRSKIRLDITLLEVRPEQHVLSGNAFTKNYTRGIYLEDGRNPALIDKQTAEVDFKDPRSLGRRP
jgi:hypothetical protein